MQLMNPSLIKASKSAGLAVVVGTLLLALTPSSFAADLYWDSNGNTPGAGATPTGTWGTSSFWGTLPDGTDITAGWTSGANAVFSAGGDATGPFTVTISGTQTAGAVTLEEGTVTLAGSGAAAVGTGSVTVAPGAKLSINSQARFTASLGAVLNLDGST